MHRDLNDVIDLIGTTVAPVPNVRGQGITRFATDAQFEFALRTEESLLGHM